MRVEHYTSDGVLAHKASQWMATLRAEVPPRPHLVLRPETCALLVVDMNRYFTHPDGPAFLPAARDIIPHIHALLERWRANGWPLAFTRHGHAPGKGGMLERFFGEVIPQQSHLADIIEELTPGDGEHVIPKSTYDAFYNTDLERLLREQGVTQVLITGVLTHMCCETTARAAFCRGFEVYIPVDATAASTEEAHLRALKNMATCVGMPVTTRGVLE